MSESNDFAIVTRDETRLESRLIHGVARRRGTVIDARDDCDNELLALCDRESAIVRAAVAGLREGRARFVVSATREGGSVAVSSTISLTILDLSIVTTPPHLTSDYEMLLDIASVPAQGDEDPRGLPLVWRNGSGAVLMHEAVGHPAERGTPALQWPSWMRVGAPLVSRRQSFTDVPLPRMTTVRVDAKQTMDLPQKRVDVLLVAGGRYEPLTDRVALFISAADLVDGNESVRLRPFTIEASRAEVATALRGASGEVRRYPGVICSKEGQELFVGSYAPDLVTEF